MQRIEEIYLNNNKRDQTIKSLICFGTELFKTSYVIQNLTTLEDILIQHERDPGNPTILIQVLNPFIWEKLVDDIKIITCFENIMKSQLIYKGFIVHNIKGKLRSEQSTTPIEVGQIESLKQNGNSLTESTLKVSLLLTEKNYYSHLSISENIRNTLIELNDSRNRLHLLDTLLTSFSLKDIANLKLMNSHVDLLIDKLKGSS